MTSIKRISRELEDVKKDPLSGVTLEVIDENDLSHLKGTFVGPPGTPYEGGLFKVDIQIPSNYPFKPPKVQFDSKIYHPNISSVTGAICLDILKNAWTPILTLKSTLISLQSLLQSPEPSDPQDAQVASVFLKDKREFDRTAKEWTFKYAPNPDYKGNPDDGKSHSSNEASEQDENNRKKTKVEKVTHIDGIEIASIEMFENMGFSRPKILDVLKKLGLTRVEDNDGDTKQEILEELLR
ncbi:Ubiquitin-conjugating enzyme subunit [Komagataella phaffii CBS 7435]|uniref:Ubiquitin-conjugating enzyme E2 1 n=2 Tax=Komagataella phaffii TaxID=460519 RepID=C4R7V5_KOMPG|nr:Ubiquitin-conjugating enzyme that mediates selective degradation of short-lived and abnormal protein [Komagataella phaffii GS115]AOA64948.1 GQ67_04785T0 [Komagataella phaffii]CAH2450933.1 Ubiquitin-conjugating enzyme subunit [Komagataella phaffii CBS 7435]AOA69787.1 GQ68_04757T0 [Komagataella phaffii GS115]CAY71680.1 Ubiquitin-conjugating enzyme that mediates selective degradation of short-lived and abnormal protein [Komagataella phaffii GS115]CCA40717.1 Ubiquitin-conjugating enzyme subunit